MPDPTTNGRPGRDVILETASGRRVRIPAPQRRPTVDERRAEAREIMRALGVRGFVGDPLDIVQWRKRP